MQPYVTVITAVRNAERTLPETLESLLGQTLTSWESIVVDDGSTDGSRAVAESYAARDPRFRVIDGPGVGVAAARNRALDEARGAYVSCLDSDDRLLPEGLARLSNAAGAGGAYGAVRLINADGSGAGWTYPPSVPVAGLDDFLDSNRFQPVGMLLSREALGRDRFREDLPVVEDYDLWLRLAERGVVWRAIEDEVGAYRLTPGSLSRRFADMARCQLRILGEAFERVRRVQATDPLHDVCAGIDASAGRARRILTLRVLECATSVVATATDGSGLDTAAGLIDECLGGEVSLDPAQVGSTTYWHVPHARCRAPSVWTEGSDAELSEICGRLGAWWSRCVERGWLSAEGLNEALFHLAGQTAQPQSVAAAIAQRVRTDRAVVLLGLGRNARAVAAALGSRGVKLYGRDDRVAGGSTAVIGGSAVEVLGGETPWDGEASYVMTPSEDEGFLASLPGGVEPIRFSEMQRAAGVEPLERLRRLWPGEVGTTIEAKPTWIGTQRVDRSDDEIERAIGVLREAGTRAVQRAGWHLQPNDFYTPLNEIEFLEQNRDLWADAHVPEGIDWRVDEQLGVMDEVCAHAGELSSVPGDAASAGEAWRGFHWENGFWQHFDAVAQYGLVRSRKPGRYVEIGCGYSSLLLASALERNAAEGAACEVVQIEPYPREELMERLPADWKRLRCVLQRAPLALFDRLEAGDVVFYDGSHCAKAGSDVNWFVFRVLPRLKPGVLVHIHDMFFPRDYPEAWMVERAQTWNEQYVVQALLMDSVRYRVELCNAMVSWAANERLAEALGGVQPASGSSLWLRIGEGRS